MPTAQRSNKRKHSNLRPKHKHTKDFLKVYWPYMPLLSILIILTCLISPWNNVRNRAVLGYAINITSTGLLDATNNERSRHNSPSLTNNDKLSLAAQQKANDMVERNYWSHNTPDQEAPWIFIDNVGYSYRKAGENLAYGFKNNEQVISGWLNSPTHRANMLDSGFDQVGFGIANSPNFIGAGKSTVIVAMYASSGGMNNRVAATANQNVQSQTINRAESITNGSLPWLSYIIGITTGAALMYVFVKHSLGFKRALSRSEKFIIKHPVLDATLIAIALLGIVLTQKIGIIL